MSFVIAEAGVNHDGNVKDAHRLVEVAAQAGADAVKFQTFDADALAVQDAPKAAYQRRTTDPDETSTAMLRRLELPEAAVHELAAHAGELGLEFMSTPFDIPALHFLCGDVGIGRLKISSGDLTHGLLLREAARSGLPVIISTGMATMAEVADALDLLATCLVEPDTMPTRHVRAGRRATPEGGAALGERVTVLHCTSQYPAELEDVNLRAMVSLAKAFEVPVGYSDHSTGITVPIAATALGATVIEKHFTLDRGREGPDHEASLEPGELAEMIERIRQVQLALGDGVKEPREAELDTAQVARRGVRAARDIKAGDVLVLEDLDVRRPQKGGDPMGVFDVLGTPVGEDLQAGALLETTVRKEP